MFHMKHIKVEVRYNMRLNDVLKIIQLEEWLIIYTDYTIYQGLKNNIPSLIIERNYEVTEIEISKVMSCFIILIREN